MDVPGLGLLLIVGLLLVKEAGVPVPVPGDLLVIGLGVGAADGRFDPWLALVAAVVATVVGGAIQFAVLRGPGRSLLLGILRRVGIGEARIEPHAARFRERGAAAVAVARMTPGVRIVAIAAAALAAVPFGRFVAGLAAGNAAFTSGHFALGVGFGAAASGIVTGLTVPVVVLVALAAIGLIGWRVLRRRRSGAEVAAEWSDAACPACLVLAAIPGES
jgi:membrane protein DedA with SNARE-associated domain